ncbi:lipoprotein, partial [Streptomyces sp. AcH 505]
MTKRTQQGAVAVAALLLGSAVAACGAPAKAPPPARPHPGSQPPSAAG